MAGKDLLSRLADAGEEAIQRLSESPGADRVTGVAHAMRDRMDELQKRVRGVDALEKRVAELEMRLEELAGARRAARVPATRKKATTSRRRATPSATGSAAGARKGQGTKATPTERTASKASTRRSSPSKRGSTGKTGGESPG